MEERKRYYLTIEIGNWNENDILCAYNELCVKNWAPWLTVPLDSVEGRLRVFGKGQLLAKDYQGKPIGYTFLNRIDWTGNKDDLRSWKEIAGTPTTFENTYAPEGNTLVLMSMTVHSDFRGMEVAKKLIEGAKTLSKELSVDQLIGSFRPNQYGKFKLQNPGFSDFDAYCRSKRDDGLPVDEWLRNLTRNGMEIMKEDTEAIRGTFSLNGFYNFRQSHHPEIWVETSPNVWECGEVGQWTVDGKTKTAKYSESAVWGQIALN